MKTTFRKVTCTLLKSGFLMLVLFTLSHCKKAATTTPSTSTTPPANEVWIQNMAFGPSPLTVTVNTTVKWTNKDSQTHTVTSMTGLFDSGSVAPGGTFSYKFTSTGSFSYACQIHASMTGIVTVH